MADVFTKSNATDLLRGKHVIFLGGSNMRALYKDTVYLLNHNALIGANELKRKVVVNLDGHLNQAPPNQQFPCFPVLSFSCLSEIDGISFLTTYWAMVECFRSVVDLHALEPSFMGDKLLAGDKLTRGRDYTEVRQFKTIDFHLDFYFITKCMNKYVEEIATKVKTKKMPAPDIIFMNSFLWDVTRWGPDGVSKYRDNMVKLMKLLKSSLPPETLFVWTTAPPVSQHCYGGTLIKQIEFLRHTLRFEVMEANMYTRDVVGVHGFHVLDLHYYFRMQMILRAKDGVHWLAPAVRFMTNLLLTHVALSFDHPLPGNFEGSLLGEMKELMELHSEEFMPVALPRLPLSLVLKDPELTATSPQVTAIVRSPLCKPPVPKNPRQKWKKKTRRTKNNDKENMHSCAVPRLKTHEYQPLLSLNNCERLQSARPLQYTNKMDGSTNFAWSSSLVANVNKYGTGSANHSTGNWTAASCHNASLVTQRYRQMSDMLVVAIEDEIATRVQSRNACETAGASQEQWWSDSYAPPDSSWNPPKYSSRHRRRPMPY